MLLKVTWHTRNLCSAFNPSKLHTHTHTHTPWTHTRSSGQPFILHFNVGHNGGTWKPNIFWGGTCVPGVKSLRTTDLKQSNPGHPCDDAESARPSFVLSEDYTQAYYYSTLRPKASKERKNKKPISYLWLVARQVYTSIPATTFLY